MNSIATKKSDYWFSWLQLARISALPSAISNVCLGYILAMQAGGQSLRYFELAFLILASASLYSAGMILNDVFDVETDRVSRPDRPLPSGRIRVSTANRCGFMLLGLGIIFAAFASWIHGPNNFSDIARPILTSVVLTLLIIAYDGWFKRFTVFAAILMGMCRSLNLLLGASTVVGSEILWFPMSAVWLAAALGIYVTGITLFARNENDQEQSRRLLYIGGAWMLVGVAGMALSQNFVTVCPESRSQLIGVFPWIMAILAFPVFRRVLIAIIDRSPRATQSAIIASLRTIIPMDAALCIFAAPEYAGYSLSVLSLLVPAGLLGRWLKPT